MTKPLGRIFVGKRARARKAVRNPDWISGVVVERSGPELHPRIVEET